MHFYLKYDLINNKGWVLHYVCAINIAFHIYHDIDAETI